MTRPGTASASGFDGVYTRTLQLSKLEPAFLAALKISPPLTEDAIPPTSANEDETTVEHADDGETGEKETTPATIEQVDVDDE